jgi:hypothetical protein
LNFLNQGAVDLAIGGVFLLLKSIAVYLLFISSGRKWFANTSNQKPVTAPVDLPEKKPSRSVSRIAITPLYGTAIGFITAEDAAKSFDQQSVCKGSRNLRKFEIRVEFSNGDKVEASLETAAKVKEFLNFAAR